MKKINILTSSNPKWTGLAINGAIALVIGLIFIFLPKHFTESIVKILGVALAVSGFVMLFFSFFRRQHQGAINIYLIIQGILNLALGLIMFINPSLMIDFIMFVLGLWALIIGLFQIFYALKVRKTVNSGMILLINGIIFMGLGLMMIINPEIILHALLSIVGALIALLGVVLFYFSFIIYKNNKITTSIDVTEQEE